MAATAATPSGTASSAIRLSPCASTFHASGPDGWIVVVIHDSKESWESFRDGTLMPAIQAGIEGGFAAPPSERTFEVQNQQ